MKYWLAACVYQKASDVTGDRSATRGSEAERLFGGWMDGAVALAVEALGLCSWWFLVVFGILRFLFC